MLARKFNSLLMFLIVLMLFPAVLEIFAQRFGGGGGRRYYDLDSYRTPRQIPQHGNETPSWTNAAGFDRDVFTFVRIKRERQPYGSGGSWHTDTPDSDLNLSFRLQQTSSIKVDSEGLFLRLSEKELAEYPFIYMVEPGSLYLDDEEAQALRKYLLNGGFLMLDDFWGEREWANMAVGNPKKVLLRA